MENRIGLEGRLDIDRKNDRKYFAGILLFSVVVYFLLISQRLTNTYDGLWYDTFSIGGWWEVVIGRWLWPVVDALRFGVQTDPLNSLLTLSCASASFVLIRKLFTEKDSPLTYLAGMSFLAGGAVSIQLSYRFMSPVFGFALLFSVFAAFRVIRIRDTGRAILSGAVWLALSLGLYQADLGCFCVILLAYFMMLLFKGEDRKQVHTYMIKSLGSAAAGMILYYLVLNAVLLITGWKLADYNGASQVSVLYILKNLPAGIRSAYQVFGTYFFQNEYRSNVLQAFGFYILAFAVLGIGLLLRFRALFRRRNIEYILLGAAAAAVMPVACSAMQLVTSEATWRMQMAAGLDLLVPVWILLLDATRTDVQENRERRRVFYGGLLILAFLAVYGSVYMRVIDQEAMHEGTKTLKVMSDRIADDLMDFGYFEEKERLSVVFVGRPSSNPTFLIREYYLYANSYAQMGRFWLGGDNSKNEWRSVFRNITPIDLAHASKEVYSEIYKEEEVGQMPIYPEKGYIRRIGDVIVVKISDDYAVGEQQGPLADLPGVMKAYWEFA